MESVMDSRYDFDLIYITERIISVFFLPDLDEHHYRSNLKDVAAMLKSKHQEKFLVSFSYLHQLLICTTVTGSYWSTPFPLSGHKSVWETARHLQIKPQGTTRLAKVDSDSKWNWFFWFIWINKTIRLLSVQMSRTCGISAALQIRVWLSLHLAAQFRSSESSVWLDESTESIQGAFHMKVWCIRFFDVFPLPTVITLVFESVWVRWSESVFKET